MKKQIFKNLFSNYLGNFLSMLLGFLIVPFLVAKLGKEAFGISVLAESIIAFFQIFAFSIRIALSRHAAIALAQKDLAGFSQYLSTGRFVLNIAAGVCFAVGAIVSFYFPQIFTVPPELYTQSQVLFLLIVIAFSITIPNVVSWAVLYSHQRFDLINYSNFGGVILRAIAIFVLFNVLPPVHQNLITYGFVYLIMTWGQNYIVYRWQKKLMPDLKIDPAERSLAKHKELIAFGGYSSIAGVAAVSYDGIMNIVINLVWGPGANTLYSISSKIPVVFKKLFLTTGSSLSPTFAALAGSGDRARLKQLFFFYSKMISILILPVAFLIAVFSKEIIVAWVGPDFLPAAEIMPLFLAANVLTIPNSICNCVNTAFGQIKIPALVTLGSSLLSALLGYLFGFVLGFELKGIALAVLIMNAFTFAVFMPLYSCKVAGLSAAEYFSENLLKPLFLVLLFGGLFLLFHSRYPQPTAGLMCLFVLVPLYLTEAYRMLLSDQERNAIKDLLAPWFNKFIQRESSVTL